MKTPVTNPPRYDGRTLSKATICCQLRRRFVGDGQAPASRCGPWPQALAKVDAQSRDDHQFERGLTTVICLPYS